MRIISYSVIDISRSVYIRKKNHFQEDSKSIKSWIIVSSLTLNYHLSWKWFIWMIFFTTSKKISKNSIAWTVSEVLKFFLCVWWFIVIIIMKRYLYFSFQDSFSKLLHHKSLFHMRPISKSCYNASFKFDNQLSFNLKNLTCR